MPRDYRAGENTKRAKARREFAMERNELRQASSPRTPAAGPTSMALKAADPADALLIEAWLAQNRGDK
jgi:hypothetical protein